MYVIGFTGTQDGMTEEQVRRLGHTFQEILTRWHEVAFHHGDCVGADVQAHALFHDMVLDMQVPTEIVIHPPDIKDKRAYADKFRGGLYTKVPIRVCREFRYLLRNQHIVDVCDILIAAPRSHAETQRSGTWATCRAARKQNKQVFVVYPNGTFESNWTSNA